jgi:hypothetical protein
VNRIICGFDGKRKPQNTTLLSNPLSNMMIVGRVSRHLNLDLGLVISLLDVGRSLESPFLVPF